MYAVVINVGLPTVINQSSLNYPDFIMSGYEVIKTGTEKECQEFAEELIQEFIID